MTPTHLTCSQLLDLIDRIRLEIASGDSFEGNLQYEAVDATTYAVTSAYRTGNSRGQGGMRLIGAIEEAPNA